MKNEETGGGTPVTNNKIRLIVSRSLGYKDVSNYFQ